LDGRAIAITAVLALTGVSVGGVTVASMPGMTATTKATVPLPRLSPFDTGQRKKPVPPVAAPSTTEKGDVLLPLGKGRAALVPFANSAFPYEGSNPDSEIPFLDAIDGTRRGHTSGRAGVLWEDETYSDRNVLLAFPPHFNVRRPAVIVVFFHGNEAILSRDVVARQRVVDQVAASGLNAILVAPQLAHDARDSSAGNFWKPGFFAAFLDEAATKLAELQGAHATAADFQRLPVILVAYSGGYDAAGFALAVGGTGDRVHGVVLLDAMYGEQDKFVDWIAEHRRSAFFFSAFSRSSAAGNADAEDRLTTRHIHFRTALPRQLELGAITFFATDPDLDHDAFVTEGWVQSPLQWLLSRVPAYRRGD
jgi:hypothetical protein